MVPKLFLLVTVLALSIKDSHLQLAKLGQCPKGVKPAANFDAKKFSGTWYEIKRYPTLQAMGTCLSIQYAIKSKMAEVTASQTMGGSKIATKAAYQIDATSQVNYKLNMGIYAANATMYILDTDYTSYAVMYSCGCFFNSSTLQFANIFSRTRTMTATVLEKATNALTKNQLDTSSLITSRQSDCQ